MNNPVNPSFTIQKRGVRGYKSHGHVILMLKADCDKIKTLVPGHKRLASLTNTKCVYYSTYTIRWKLPFCLLTCTEPPLAKTNDLILLEHSKCFKNCHKKFLKSVRKIKPKNGFVNAFCMYKGDNPIVFKIKILAD